MQAVARGARFERTVTDATTHLVLVHPPGFKEAALPVVSSTATGRMSTIKDPLRVLEAIKLHGGGDKGLSALRTLVQERAVHVHDARCVCVGCQWALPSLETQQGHHRRPSVLASCAGRGLSALCPLVQERTVHVHDASVLASRMCQGSVQICTRLHQ